MKCSTCKVKKCKRKHKNCNECVGKVEDINCSCLCQVTATRTIIVTSLSVIIGCAIAFSKFYFIIHFLIIFFLWFFSGGILLTVIYSSLYIIAAGAVVTVFGTSLVAFSLKKLNSGDRMSLSNTFQAVGLRMCCPKMSNS